MIILESLVRGTTNQEDEILVELDGVEAFMECFEGTETEMDMINYEATKYGVAFECATYVTDVIFENQIVTEGAEEAILLESFVKEWFAKAKEWVQRMWKTVKKFFSAAMDELKIRIASGEKFVEEYADRLKAAPTKDFSMTMHELTPDKGRDAFKKAMNNAVGLAEDVVGTDILNDKPGMEGGYQRQKDQEIFGKIVSGAKSKADIVKHIKQAFFGGSEEKQTVKTINVDQYIQLVQENKTTLADLKTGAKIMDEFYKTVLKNIQVIEKEVKEDEAKLKSAKAAFDNVKLIAATANTISATATSCYKTTASEAKTALKHLLIGDVRANAKKKDEKKQETAITTLESAMGLIM